jgi:hypothetical protein
MWYNHLRKNVDEDDYLKRQKAEKVNLYRVDTPPPSRNNASNTTIAQVLAPSQARNLICSMTRKQPEGCLPPLHLITPRRL